MLLLIYHLHRFSCTVDHSRIDGHSPYILHSFGYDDVVNWTLGKNRLKISSNLYTVMFLP